MTWYPKNKKELKNLFIKSFSITAAFTEIWIRFGEFCQDQYQMLTKRRGLRKVLSQPSCSALICPPFSVLAAQARCENLHPPLAHTETHKNEHTQADANMKKAVHACFDLLNSVLSRFVQSNVRKGVFQVVCSARPTSMAPFPSHPLCFQAGNTGQHWGACTKCWGVGV